MDLLKAQLAKIQQQLAGLTATQKMLSMALVAIMAMTLAYLARYAGQADMEPLLDQSFSADDMAQVTARLDARNIHYTVTGDRILVPTESKIEALADLSFAHLLPERTNDAFDEIVKQMSPFDAADKTAQLWLEAKSRYLQEVINKFPHVRDANVMIDPTDQRHFDGHDIVPTAMIYITTSNADGGDGGGGGGGGSARQIAIGAADLVSGAVAGLARSSIKVVVDGVTISLPDNSTDDGLLDGDTILQAKRQYEEMYRDKIMKQLGFIKGLFVSVTVDLKTDKVEQTETKVDAKSAAHLSRTEEDHTTESTGGAGGGGEPGANPNLSTNGPVSVAGGGGGGSTSNEEETKSTYTVVIPTTVVHTLQGPGAATPLAASVRVPRSYFVQMYKDTHKDAEPDDAALAALVTDESAHIAQDVKNCTAIKDDTAIAVNWYSDGASALGAGGNAPAAPASSAVSSILLSHVREIGVGMLAMVSLAMVMMMVRKSAPVPIPPDDEAAERQKATQRLEADMPLAGEVSEGDKMMDGMELDDEAVKTQQMIEQVSSMVTENPDSAANLVKRWLNRS